AAMGGDGHVSDSQGVNRHLHMVAASLTRHVPQLLPRSRSASNCERALFRDGAYRTDVAAAGKVYRQYRGASVGALAASGSLRSLPKFGDAAKRRGMPEAEADSRSKRVRRRRVQPVFSSIADEGLA